MTYVALLKIDNKLLLEGKRCITSVQELYKTIAHRVPTEIEIRREFSDLYFTPSGLSDLLESAKKLNPFLHIKMEGKVEDFSLHKVKTLKSLTSVDEITYMLQKYPKDMMDTISMLCSSYEQSYSETLLANSKVASLHLLNTKLQSEQENLKEEYEALTKTSNETKQVLHSLMSRINHSYQKPLNANTGVSLLVNKYSRIIYIKEVTRVRYIDTLVYYLQEILKTAYGVSARLLVIESYYSYDKSKLYPRLIPHWSLTYNDVRSADILMAGYQPSLMDDILHNPSEADYMIILDRGGNDALHVTGPGVVPIYTMSDLEDNYINASNKYIISYSPDTLYIPYIEGFEDMSTEARISKYSSTVIIKSIMDMLG